MYFKLNEVKRASTISEMISEIDRLSSINPIVRATMDYAEYNDIPKQDMYIMLAYYALDAESKAQNALLEYLSTRTTTIQKDFYVPHDFC
jgi:hypothetical protein